MIKEIFVNGDYDQDDNMYIAKYTYGDKVSIVKGRSKNTKILKEAMGVIRGIEHAINYCEFLGIHNFKIYHNSQYVANIFNRPKPDYPELASARKIFAPYKSNIVYKEGINSEM